MAESSVSSKEASGRGDIDIADALRVIWRRRLPLLCFVLLAAGAALLFARSITPRYSAETLISVEPRSKLLQLAGDEVPRVSDLAYVDTQVEVLRSPALAQRVIDAMRLYDDPEFNISLQSQPSVSEQITAAASGLISYAAEWLPLAITGPARPPEGQSDGGGDAAIRVGVIDTFLSKLSVTPRGTSYVISVVFTSKEARKAAAIAGAIGDLFLQSQAENKLEASKHASNWLRDRLGELRQELIQAEEAVGQYRDKEGFTKGYKGSVAEQQVSELNGQLVVAESDYSRIAARLDEARRSLADGLHAEGAPEVLNSPAVVSLQTEETKLATKEAAMSHTFGDNYPKLAETRSALRDVRKSIKTEAEKIVQTLSTDAAVARGRVLKITHMLDELRNRNSTRNQAEVHLRELEREAEARRQSYMSLLARQQEISAQQSFQVPDARIIGRAEVPPEPSSPKVKLIIATATLAALLIGTMTILAIETRRKGVLSKEQFEGVSGLPVLSIVPAIRKGAGGSLPALASALDRSDVLRQGAARALFAAMSGLPQSGPAGLPVDRGHRARVVLITSAVPGEGKSMCAAIMALKAAQAGKRCIVLDCDFRRRGLETLLGEPNRDGLAQVFAGERALDEVIRKLEPSGLHFISSGSGAGVFEKDTRLRREMNDKLMFLLGSRMQRLIAMLASEYDLIVIDSPPVMATEDGIVLSQLVDETMFVIRWRDTKADVALAALRQLQDTGAKIRGVVLSQVDTRQYARYGFVDSHLGSRLFEPYY